MIPFRKHPERRISFLTLLLVITAIWGVSGIRIPLTEMRQKRIREDIDRTQAMLEETVAANQKLAMDLIPYWTMRESAIQQPADAGTVLFRERIEGAAAAAGMKSRNTGNIRQIEVADKVMLYEVSFAADGTTEAVVAFLKSLYQERPRLYFRTLTIKPAVPGQADVIGISATLCALNFTAPEAESSGEEVQP